MKACRVLITGATAGIGRATALLFAEQGHEVFACGRRAGELKRLTTESGGRIHAFVMDVNDNAAIGRARARIDKTSKGYGLDILVNNAGFGQGGPLELISDAELRAQHDTNVFGLMAVTRAFLPAMRERGAGRIINVGSIAGSLALPFLGAYASTKHAIQGLSESLRRELRPHGVKVIVIRPGAIRTEFGEGEAQGLERYAEKGSPYREQILPFREWHKTLHPNAPEPTAVARAILQAATAAKPRPYYVVPVSNLTYIWLQKLIPAARLDRLLEKIIGLQ